MTEPVNYELGITGQIDPDRIPDLVQRLTEISELSGISLTIGELRTADTTTDLHEELPNLDRDLVDFKRLSDGRKVPVITLATFTNFARNQQGHGNPQTQPWHNIGRKLTPVRSVSEQSTGPLRRVSLSEEQAAYYGHFGGDGFLGEITYLYAERFGEFLDYVEELNRVYRLRNLGSAGLRLMRDYHDRMFSTETALTS